METAQQRENSQKWDSQVGSPAPSLNDSSPNLAFKYIDEKDSPYFAGLLEFS